MAENSKIEWTDHTFNPWIGCAKVSPGCTNCYAEVSTPVRTARAKGRELWGKGQPRQRTSAANWKQPLKWNREAAQALDDAVMTMCEVGGGAPMPPRRPRVFCASLSDWLDDEVPIEWLADLLKLIHDTPNLDWLLLTKRPENWENRITSAALVPFEKEDDAFVEWLQCWWLSGSKKTLLGKYSAPENVWIGTTVEDQKRADERIPKLLKIPAKVRFLSVEPQLEEINLRRYFAHSLHCEKLPGPGMNGGEPCRCQWPNWVICGGESGHKRRPFNCDWARSLRDQCKAAGVHYFFKQIDKVQPIPADLMIREFPNETAR